MARYIDADWIYEKVENRYRVSSGIEHRCERDLLDLICYAPDADVVPRSEVEALQTEVGRLEKENTELLVSKETDVHISMEKLVTVRTEHPIFKAIEEKVAREIFEEIEEIFNKKVAFYTDIAKQSSGDEKQSAEILIATCKMHLRDITELKKKYIQPECPDCKHFVSCEPSTTGICDEFEEDRKNE